MSVSVLNPALSHLIRIRAVAGYRRVCRSFRSPRRLTLSIIAVLLACLWLGNAVVSILMREPYAPETIRSWIPFSLTVYAIWHLLKVAWKRPESAVDWSPAEESLLVAGPFDRRELLSYRLTAILITSSFKALIASLLLLPDLPIWPIGFLGFLLALTALELMRMLAEIVTFGISSRAYFWFRTTVFTLAGTVFVAGLVAGILTTSNHREAGNLSSVRILSAALQSMIAIRHTWIGQLVEAPFAVFAYVVTATDPLGLELFGWLVPGLTMVAIFAWSVIRLDRHFHAVRIRNEQSTFQPGRTAVDNAVSAGAPPQVSQIRIPRMAGVGPVAWRQWIGAARHKWELLLVLCAPAGLSLIPLVQSIDASTTFFQVFAGMIFYSFLLLPAALKFDFRRDFGRFAMLKSLPVSSKTVVFGQLATPVILTSLFQLSVLFVAVCSRPVPAGYVLAAVLLLLPINIIIYALENLIFLLYPHRWNQDGVEIFLRTMLVFTAKALLFGVALVLFFMWASLSHVIAAAATGHTPYSVHHGTVFLVGLTLGTTAAAYLLGRLLIRVFHRYDPSLDVSA